MVLSEMIATTPGKQGRGVMAKKKKKKDRKPRPGRVESRQFLEKFAEAEASMQRGQWAQARDQLQALDRRYPRRGDVLNALAHTAFQLRDYGLHQVTCERLAALYPNEITIVLLLAGAYLTNGHPLLGLRTFQRAAQRWPDHPQVAENRQAFADVESKVPEILAAMGLSGADALELATLHEEVQALLAQSEFARARQVAEQLLARRPEFVPALNNLGEAWFREGHVDRAVAAAQRVLALDVSNVHALANLTRYLTLAGRADDARAWAAKLRAASSSAPDRWLKTAEALSYLGDDQGVLDAVRGAEREGKPLLGDFDALLCHLGAVAAYRLGQEDEARQLWKKSRHYQKGFALTQANLDDLDRPAAERHAPWPFPFNNWLFGKIVRDLATALGAVTQRSKEGAVARELERQLAVHPELAALVPMLLDRGDPAGRTFALTLAETARTPALLAALRDFALSQRGPDEQRMRAAEAASQAGLLPKGMVRMWSQGKWHEVMLLGYEVTWEPKRAHSRQVEALAIEALQAIQTGDGGRAEQLLRQALEREPDSPDLLNNLAAAFQAQRRFDEGEALMAQVHERYPDYFFGRIAVAGKCILDGDLEQAKARLEPLLQQRRLHVTEFAALCNAEIELSLALGSRDAARAWLDMWERVQPDNPQLDYWRQQLRGPSWWQRLTGR
jgi:predicted Zn-dependent protease